MDLDGALAIIDAAAERSHNTVGADEVTLEALRFLWRERTNREELRQAILWFKNTLEWSEHDIGRSQNANASRNRIRWLLGRRAA